MIKKFLQKVFKKKEKAVIDINRADDNATSAAQIITAKKHKIDKGLISSAALKTCEGLQKAGFKAYIVGGAVRDLLLNYQPKDFDIATDATPEQVYKVFRRSRIIGRRFRLVHVMWGAETIEVSTFRGHHEANGDAQVNDSGRILRDNVFGNLEEDSTRRDFTVNAMYYDPAREEVLDFHNGIADVKSKLLRIIGDPKTRYKEDPVRMLRAVRLSAKLGLKIEAKTQAPILELADLLQDVPPSRLFDEMLKLFLSGHAVESINILREQHLHHGLLPLLDVVLEQPMGEKFVMLALKNTDDRIKSGKSSNPSFLFATLLWHEVLSAWELTKNDAPLIPALYNAMNEVIHIQAEKLAIHNRFVATMKEIWSMQPRFEQRAGKRPFGLLTHPRYRAGYDFMLLRCDSGELPMEIGEWWTIFADANAETRAAMLLPDNGPKKKRKRRRKTTTHTQVNGADA
ncbi:MAG: polynucleotide adenylyltransferase PcnB [Methylophilaceae bacterium]